jgi:TolA-binding protein
MPTPGQPQAQTASAAASQQALELVNSGKTSEAIAAYEKILHDFSTSMEIWEAYFRLGSLYYQNGQYDKAMDYLKKIQPPASQEIQEMAYLFLPQISVAKASKLPPGDPRRKAGYEEAIKQYDALIQKFPDSDRMETIVYRRALALFQSEKYEEAATTLRSNLAKYAGSESILESQYLLAFDLAAQAATMLQARPGDPQAFAKYDEAAKLLGDIIQKHTDVAVANDAQFQLGEVLLGRAGFVDKSGQQAAFAGAVEAFRAVAPREMMIKAQQDRIAGIRQRIQEAVTAKNLVGIKHFKQLLEHEQDDLADLKSKSDQTMTAKIRIAQAFYNQQRYDEARLMLNDLRPFVTDDAQSKTILYYITLSYAGQNLADKAVAAYNEFKSKYKNDPQAENLPLVIGSLFLNPDPKVNDPNQAIQYFKEETALYPNGRFTTEALTRQAAAMVQLKQFDEALGAFKSLLATNPPRETAAAAELGIGSIYTQTGKLNEALAAFQAVCDKYADTPSAEQAAYYTGQTAIQMGDQKRGIAGLTQFIAKYPESTLVPNAMYYLASVKAASGESDAALEKFKEVSEKFPKSDVAQFTYFQRAQIYAGRQKVDEIIGVMKEFIAAYPDSDKIYFAYDSIAQNQVNAGQLQEAIATYDEFAGKHPGMSQVPEALLKISDLWRRYAEAPGRYLVLNEEQRVQWNKGVNGSIAAAEKILEQFSGSPQVALALQTLLVDQKLLLTAKLKTGDGVRQYFLDFAKKFQNNPSARSKVLFTLASYIYETDKSKALDQMNAAYDPKLVYAPADLDLYGSALIDQNKIPEAQNIYKKLAADYPNPPGVAPDKAPAQIAEAQSIALYGMGKCLQQQGNAKEAGEAFDNLKKWYPWSPKLLEANFGIAQSLYQQKKYDEALALLIPIMRAQSASATVDLRANAMLLGGRIQEAQGHIEAAIDYYIKIGSFYEGVPVAAAEGLWRGAQLLEKQAAGLNDTGAVTKSGQFAKAMKAYQGIVEKYPSSPYADQAAKRLSDFHASLKK